jgi:carbohydrate-selective porin OprB
LTGYGGWIGAAQCMRITPSRRWRIRCSGAWCRLRAFLGRPQDTLGFAASWFQVSGALTATQELEQALDEPLTDGGLLASSLRVPVGVQSHEAELEAEYTAKVDGGAFITPDIQIHLNPTARRG